MSLRDELKVAREEELRLRNLGNDEGLAKARAGEITERDYKNRYYAPVIRLQFRILELEQLIADEGEEGV